MEKAAGQERHTFSGEGERTGKLTGTRDDGPPTMRAVVLSEPGGVDKLVVKDVPLPQVTHSAADEFVAAGRSKLVTP